MRPLPESARLTVPPAFAGELLDAAERLPRYANEGFYALDLQAEVRDRVRSRAAEAYDLVVSEVSDRLARWPYCAVAAGLRFDDGNRLFVALLRCFGDLVARPFQKPRAQLVHYIRPATDIASSRAGSVTESERLHTDAADWAEPVELLAMQCVRPDEGGGGRSLLMEAGDLRQEIGERLGAGAVALLESQPVPWRLADYHGGGVAWRPVLAETTVCWRRYTIDAAIRGDGAAVPQQMLALLDAVDEILLRSDRRVEFFLEEGELMVLDNRRALHARTPISTDRRASSRLMLRSWIRAPGPRTA